MTILPESFFRVSRRTPFFPRITLSTSSPDFPISSLRQDYCVYRAPMGLLYLPPFCYVLDLQCIHNYIRTETTGGVVHKDTWNMKQRPRSVSPYPALNPGLCTAFSSLGRESRVANLVIAAHVAYFKDWEAFGSISRYEKRRKCEDKLMISVAKSGPSAYSCPLLPTNACLYQPDRVSLVILVLYRIHIPDLSAETSP